MGNKKRKLRVTPATEIERIREQRNVEQSHFALQRRLMEAEANRPYKFKDTSFFDSVYFKKTAANHTRSFIVMLNHPLPTAEVKLRLFKAFGDLKK